MLASLDNPYGRGLLGKEGAASIHVTAQFSTLCAADFCY